MNRKMNLKVSALTFSILMGLAPAAGAKRMITTPRDLTNVSAGQLVCFEFYYSKQEIPHLSSKTEHLHKMMNNYCDLNRPFSMSVQDLESHGCCLFK